MRAAIRARAQDLGVEKSKVSQQYIEEAAKRAAQSQGDSRPGGLDLSQISSGNEPGSKTDKWDDSLPTMLYDPADELTEEEQAQADVVGELPIFEQAMTEIKASKWPDLPTVIREVAVMFVVVAFTATVSARILYKPWNDSSTRRYSRTVGRFRSPRRFHQQHERRRFG